jgi:preprotein translocase subunit SecG
MYYVLLILLFLTAAFLIVLVLIQRGKGGGLAGALGGMGGQSAFGTKAGDLFTRITIGVAAFWIVLCMISVKYFGGGTSRLGEGGADETKPGATAPASTERPAAPAEQPASGSTGSPASGK